MRPAVRVFTTSAVLGALLGLSMPEAWSNLQHTPWFVAWLVVPAFALYAALCFATLTDAVSGGGADPLWLAALWVASLALVAGGFGLLLRRAARLLRRSRGEA